MLEKKELKTARGIKFKDTLIRELENFRVKIKIAMGHYSFGPWREGEHDDLVFALCLTCWWALQKRHFVSLDDVITDASEGAARPDQF